MVSEEKSFRDIFKNMIILAMVAILLDGEIPFVHF